MILLSDLSPDRALPHPADPRRLAIGLDGWAEALAEAGAAADPARAWSATAPGRALLAAIFGNSPFLSGVAIKEWAFLTRIVAEGPQPPFAALVAEIEERQDRGEDEATVMRRLRIAKRRLALLAAVADLAGAWPLERQTEALSRFAGAAIGMALRWLLRRAAREGALVLVDPGDPEADSGVIVLGMGKLGGFELNYSSDIDLILLHEAGRAQVAAQHGVQTFYSRLARELVRILDQRTGDGYVFRTDLRLRPDPSSTPPMLSVAAALAYYESVGQNWERAALIKARPVAGDLAAGQRFLRELEPFIWRRNLDFAAIQDIHSIKRQIDAHRGGGRIAIAGHDIKTGRGGIREIEFFAQTQQLIWGGRLRELRVAATCTALERLATCGRIDAATAAQLTADYRFLRRLEHRLQMIEDAQTHKVPADPDGIAHIAVFLGYPDADTFTADLHAHLSSVERHYAALFEEAPSLAGPGNLVFTGAEDDPGTLDTLAQLGFADPSAVAALVRGWHHGRLRATRSPRAREILTELVPELLRTFGATPHADLALVRFDRFLSQLPAGVQLFSLFHANPPLLGLVAEIMAGAPQLAEQLARRPGLLDAVLTEEFFAPPARLDALAADLDRVLAHARHFEDMLDIVRRWAGERRFQVGVQLLRRAIDGAAAGRAFAEIAEATVAALLPAVEEELARRHGRVPGGGFAVIGMGRLGSREMSLSSDLDLILVYDAPAGAEQSDGPRPLAAVAYFARLAQRLIAAITTPTPAGGLYEVDMRLRPSGNNGPIATSLDGFVHYQREEAWTWEHMALTRARAIAGPPGLRARIERAIAEILQAPRDPDRLLRDVADMRRRIAEQHRRPSPWDLKHRPGGLVDLQFIAQYLMLREAAARPAVLHRSIADALRALGAAGALDADTAGELVTAQQLLLNVQVILTLLRDGAAAAEELAGEDRAMLARCAGAVDFAALDADITAAAARVQERYERVIAAPARRLKTTGDSPR